MTTRLMAAAIAVAAAGTAAGQTKYSSPQEVFKGMKKAAKAKDGKAMVACFAPSARNQLAGMLIGSLASSASQPRPDLNQFPAKLRDQMTEAYEMVDRMTGVAKKYGVTEAELKSIDQQQFTKNVMGGGAGRDAYLKKLAGLSSDPTGMLAAMFTAAPKNQQSLMPKGELTDVKVTGDTATAKVKTAGRSVPLTFKKEGGSWGMGLPGTGGR